MKLCSALWITFEIHKKRSLGFLAFTQYSPQSAFLFYNLTNLPPSRRIHLCTREGRTQQLCEFELLKPLQVPREHHVFYHCKQILYLHIFRMCTTATSVNTNHFKFGPEKNIKLTTIWNTQNESVLVSLRRIYVICNIMQFDLYLLTQDLQVWNIL